MMACLWERCGFDILDGLDADIASNAAILVT